MPPSPETSLMAYIKTCKPILRGNVGKMAYLMHAYVTMSDCSLIAVGDKPDSVEAAPEIEMPQELAEESFVKLCYKTPDSRILEVAVLQADDSLVLHWCPSNPSEPAADNDVHSTTISPAGFFSDSENGSEGYVRGQLKDLIDKFAPGIDLILQVQGAQPAGAPAAATRRGDSVTEQDVPPPHVPDTDAHPAPPLGVHPQLPHQPHPAQGGGMHIGPNDPVFRDPLADARQPGSLPPGARFDPIAPPGLPGSHPDDFTNIGPSRQDGWNDIGPPPGGFPGIGGGRLPGRRGRGGPGFRGGGFGGGGLI